MAPTLRKTYVIGVGMTAFQKPRGLVDYPELAVEAATKALIDAGINYDLVESAFAGYVYGEVNRIGFIAVIRHRRLRERAGGERSETRRKGRFKSSWRIVLGSAVPPTC